jgi:hypothetical protein
VTGDPLIGPVPMDSRTGRASEITPNLLTNVTNLRTPR